MKIVRSPGDQRTATVKGGDLFHVRWDTLIAGVQHRTVSPVLRASIICAVLDDEWAHAGVPGPCPHIITVAIQKVDNPPKVYRQLAERAGPKPAMTPSPLIKRGRRL
ncbi:MAG TPA: hypothetical protein VLK82_10215 [Candidatus Tectomicrobia bacterium]|nr:hypothetical protein [Candidatus Tectomicrobia bacterium]